MPFLAGERDQVLAIIDPPAEHRFFRQANAFALGVEGPAVETARDAHGPAMFFAHQTRAAMRADIEESAHRAVCAACHHDRHPEIVETAEAAGLGNVGRKARDLRQFAKQQPEFLLELFGIAVGRNIEEHHLFGKIGPVSLHVVEDALKQLTAQFG